MRKLSEIRSSFS